EEASRTRRERAPPEPPLHVEDQYVLPPTRTCGGGWRRFAGRRRASRARADDRQGRQARCASPQRGRAQEVARGAAAARLICNHGCEHALRERQPVTSTP